MIILVIILCIIIVILLTLLLIHKKDIRYITKQIDRSKGQLTNIRMYTLNKDIENLSARINDLYEQNHNINLQIRKEDKKLKQSIANVSHDLRTPLTSIMGYIQLIKENNLTFKKKEKYIEIIERRTNNLNYLLSSLYDLSRVELNEYKFELKPVNLDKLLCDVLALFYNDFARINYEPIVEIDENIPLIISDEKVVIRIFSNLINNMLKHGREYFYISLKKEDGKLISEFKNNTLDLKEEDIEKLFNRFYTGNEARNDSNTGLGLYITKTFIEELGSNINARLDNGMLDIKITWFNAN